GRDERVHDWRDSRWRGGDLLRPRPADSAAGRCSGSRRPARIVVGPSLRRARAREMAQAPDGSRAMRRLSVDVCEERLMSTRASRDSRMENAIGRVLRIGVTTSSVCLALGLALSLLGASRAASNLLLTAGLVILMATPVGRVVISVGEYALERDWFFVVMTSIVLLELLGSVVAATR